MTTFLDSHSHYQYALKVYQDNTNQREIQLKWISDSLGPRLREIFAYKKNVQVLAVGTGCGYVDVDILDELCCQGHRCYGDEYHVLYQVVEPNKFAIDEFRAKCIRDDRYAKITFNWFNGTFDDFTQSETVSKYDFVHFIHSISYFNCIRALITTYGHLLEIGGFVVVIGEKKGSIWEKMLEFWKKHQLLDGCFEYKQASDILLSAWISLASKNKWAYDTYVKPYWIDVSKTFVEGSSDGNALLDICLNTTDARKQLKQEVMTDFLELFHENSTREIVNGNVKILLPLYFSVISITKQQQ